MKKLRGPSPEFMDRFKGKMSTISNFIFRLLFQPLKCSLFIELDKELHEKVNFILQLYGINAIPLGIFYRGSHNVDRNMEVPILCDSEYVN